MMKNDAIKRRMVNWFVSKMPRKGKRLIFVAVSFVYILRTVIKKRQICTEHLKKVSECLQLSVPVDVMVFPCIVASAMIRLYGIDNTAPFDTNVDYMDIVLSPSKQEQIADFLLSHLPKSLYYTDPDRIKHDIIILLRNLDNIVESGNVCHVVMEI